MVDVIPYCMLRVDCRWLIAADTVRRCIAQKHRDCLLGSIGTSAAALKLEVEVFAYALVPRCVEVFLETASARRSCVSLLECSAGASNIGCLGVRAHGLLLLCISC